ncbi:hypothetical protein BY996DRAFT_6960981 [Phakopsora pachyrhizi]|uniref:Large ribosomal subunit protein mL59 domain-containing protein n=1 Tax=Phakopsora pachyrhizi TaxID=170000 RepID=A0AAV0AIG1_PHAPC|nr:hypothetical protein BY996DRAFT_6960981 [Phakopsora pachyrhizi]CAH7667569.1 hypothetical protein PPACK8108_LOCUS1975 [Phakopsora pachyrhizi]
MIGPSNQSRLLRPALIKKQSQQFISPKSLELSTRRVRLQRIRVKSLESETIKEPKSSISLVKLFDRFKDPSQRSSPFLPQSYRFGHENSLVEPGKVRRRAPILKSQARVILSKQAFNWRLMRHIFRIEHQSDGYGNRSKEFQTTVSDRIKSSLEPVIGPKNRRRFYDGTLSLEDYQKIDFDPVPRLIQMFGGWDRLTARDRRNLGLMKPIEIKDLIRTVREKRTDREEGGAVEREADLIGDESSSLNGAAREDVLVGIPRYDRARVLPNRFGVYQGRGKPFKGKIRERNRESKTESVSKKMVEMDERVDNFRKEWKSYKEKSKPSIPF